MTSYSFTAPLLMLPTVWKNLFVLKELAPISYEQIFNIYGNYSYLNTVNI
ncbi:protein of unknown function [Vibrio tapetis subsp. tapetis]|uniref:Uncharacterized protein n=1 Tax=Vibrio tapetis subsp. tapetis TaxID=1671868 RepID=A0A2N8ZIT7_9VIBR|nr:protein of unknown function [Vibrio tapetis subsp. tapetis]